MNGEGPIGTVRRARKCAIFNRVSHDTHNCTKCGQKGRQSRVRASSSNNAIEDALERTKSVLVSRLYICIHITYLLY